MLDEKDLQQIKELMDAQKSEILQQTQALMDAQREEILHQAAQNTQVIIENTIGKQLDLAKSVLRSHAERIDALEKKFA